MAEQQLVEIARAIAVGCRVLVLDEPTSTLGRRDVERLFALIARLKANGHSIVYISHFIEEVQRGLRSHRRACATAASPAAEPPTHAAGDIVRLMVGREVDRSVSAIGEADRRGGASTSTAASPARRPFTLHRGEILGIAGLVGAGRTELLRAIFALDPVRSAAFASAATRAARHPRQRWAQGVGMVSEDRKGEGVALGLDVADNLTLTQLDGDGTRVAGVARDDNAPRRRDGFERLAIKCAAPTQPVAELSGGNQQKVAIARLLHHDVDVLAARRTDARHRRRQQGADLRDHRCPRRQRAARRASAEGDSAGEQLSSRAARSVRSHRRDAPRAAWRARGRSSEWDEHRLMLAATGTESRRVRPPRCLDRRAAARFSGCCSSPSSSASLIGAHFFLPANLELIARQTAIVCGRRARHDGGDRVGRHRSVGRLGRRADDRRHRACCSAQGWPPLAAALAGVAVGAVCGVVNGVLVTGLRVVPFIVTLGTMILVRGAAKGVADERRIEAPQTWLNDLLRTTGAGRRWLLPAGVWLVLLLALLVAGTSSIHALRPARVRDRIERAHGPAVWRRRAAHEDRRSTRSARLCAGVAGVLQFSRLSVGDPTVADGLELDVIAAVIIGGGSLSGGRGTVAGTLLGATTMAVIQIGCAQKGYPNWVQQIVTGGDHRAGGGARSVATEAGQGAKGARCQGSPGPDVEH